MGTIVVFGGRSEIGVATAERLADGKTVVLAARRSTDLAAQTAALQAAGATRVVPLEFDANAVDTHPALIEQTADAYGPIDVAVVAFGILGDAERTQTDVAHALEVAHVDYYAQISVITLLANIMREQRSGTIVVFSSIAGVRVRKANYVYGSTKAGLDGFASGLSDALYDTGVRVLLVRPGFVIGNMTKELMASGTEPAPMSVTPDQVGDAVAKAYRKGKREVAVPGRLRLVMFATRWVPRPIWRKMNR